MQVYFFLVFFSYQRQSRFVLYEAYSLCTGTIYLTMASHATEDFSSKYTNANLAPDAPAYSSATLFSLVRQLEEVDSGSISAAAPGIIVR